MSDSNLVASIAGAALGGLLAALSGTLIAEYQRRRRIIDVLIEDITQAIEYEPYDYGFDLNTLFKLRAAVLKARPGLSRERFKKCMAMLHSYTPHDPRFKNCTIEEIKERCRFDGIDPKAHAFQFGERLISQAQGFVFELEDSIH